MIFELILKNSHKYRELSFQDIENVQGLTSLILN